MFRDFPLDNHPRALPAAEAALCAKDQGRFWEYHDKLLANQGSLSDESLKKYAEELDLDGEKFGSCLDSGTYKEEVLGDQREGGKLGVTGTPAFFVNGRFLSGAQPFETFKSLIDDELAR